MHSPTVGQSESSRASVRHSRWIRSYRADLRQAPHRTPLRLRVPLITLEFALAARSRRVRVGDLLDMLPRTDVAKLAASVRNARSAPLSE